MNALDRRTLIVATAAALAAPALAQAASSDPWLAYDAACAANWPRAGAISIPISRPTWPSWATFSGGASACLNWRPIPA
jgi:hypothetical protein